ncbi:hypothetical protein TRFO_29156 [Tritrichomonas foetus]|uniref:Rab-GAP TBC domain-containing protein n=1 Tax=Tritrichomonas foetus TaxID=1144522 RepID=A0A1J4JYE3_9EUKA|nr:hypothetical protein TRFO_29156 [Tritrichomonas foetus]|eukprot:OHT03488.1 hypothetical protein TRFO_29156 [Tritrichomonas foetus]
MVKSIYLDFEPLFHKKFLMRSSANEFKILPLANPSFDREQIDINEIRKLSALGLDQCPPEDRAVAWLCLLNIYPKDPLQWGSVKKEITKSYWAFVKDNEMEDWHTKNFPNQMQIVNFQLKRNDVMGIIHGDIVRTGRTIFFLPADPIPTDQPVCEADEFMYQFGRHARRLERVLYTFASLNVGLGYMQGFNELVIPFYYVFYMALPFLNNDVELLEALTFQCLQTLLTETPLHELYTTTDQSSIIIHRLGEFTSLTSKHLPEVSRIIETLKIHPILYCFRWFNLLFCQEHDLPDIITIWDDLFAHFDTLIEFEFYIGLGHLNEIKSTLTPTNYGDTISALQNMPEGMDLKKVLLFANKCWDIDHKVSPLAGVMRMFGKK